MCAIGACDLISGIDDCSDCWSCDIDPPTGLVDEKPALVMYYMHGYENKHKISNVIKKTPQNHTGLKNCKYLEIASWLFRIINNYFEIRVFENAHV